MLSCVRSSCFWLWVPAHSCKPQPFFLPAFFPGLTFPSFFVTGKHLMSARNPQRVSTPTFSGLLTLAYIFIHTHTRTHSLTLSHAPHSSHILHALTQHLLSVLPQFLLSRYIHCRFYLFNEGFIVFKIKTRHKKYMLINF